MALWRARTRTEYLTWTSILSDRAHSPRLSPYDPGIRLAGAACAQRHLEGRGDLGHATRDRNPAPPGCPPETGLGRPGHDRRLDKVAAQASLGAPDRDAWHPPGLAPAPDQEQMDLPE